MNKVIGTAYGWWTVIGEANASAAGEKRWLCECRCGTQRSVLERSLKHGGSTSCGCRRNHQGPSIQLAGKMFGQLKVIKYERAETRSVWLCRCTCGREVRYSTTQLISGQKTHCGCLKPAEGQGNDLSGIRFHRLVALEPLPTRDAKGSVMWRCRCDCGRETAISYNTLMYSNIKSCGCRKKEHSQSLATYLNHADGISIEMIRSNRIPSNNTSGVRGVYQVNGKYIAKIVLQGHQYHLGTYETLEEAAAVRKQADQLVQERVIPQWAKWKNRAKQEPEWGRQNPLLIHIEKKNRKTLLIHIFPEKI